MGNPSDERMALVVPTSLVSWNTSNLQKEHLSVYWRVGGEIPSEAECFRKEEFFEKHEVRLKREVDEYLPYAILASSSQSEKLLLTHPPNPERER